MFLQNAEASADFFVLPIIGCTHSRLGDPSSWCPSGASAARRKFSVQEEERFLRGAKQVFRNEEELILNLYMEKFNQLSALCYDLENAKNLPRSGTDSFQDLAMLKTQMEQLVLTSSGRAFYAAVGQLLQVWGVQNVLTIARDLRDKAQSGAQSFSQRLRGVAFEPPNERLRMLERTLRHFLPLKESFAEIDNMIASTFPTAALDCEGFEIPKCLLTRPSELRAFALSLSPILRPRFRKAWDDSWLSFQVTFIRWEKEWRDLEQAELADAEVKSFEQGDAQVRIVELGGDAEVENFEPEIAEPELAELGEFGLALDDLLATDGYGAL